ncbi:RNA polymerase III transcription factor IIIC subunit-domain-containing protein [Protomyces lactucae-debilis]|uniref:RNA polymerase III transcription factor IIIC subunit-domain-containing protein n=1 Tax=Protomyces lactucae-debilis TaxID=2754530 RepID=A0A1Y2EUJ3_PROLT|nr:RNA polymerase III transcription factor IIIC subunit-domain-containing protein [Protomyces lactucae-debilis]ORY74836.1 RNA polymerase III transcription factor IIIC subunit-domain-containing protein [Protomyces lactucae-debilis]
MAETSSRDIYPCPTHTVLLVEHPAKVKNTAKAVSSIGGPVALRKLADEPEKTVLGLKFRPGDRYEHPKLSTTVKTNNMIIRCRKRVDQESLTYKTGKTTILQRPMAMVKHTVRFRGMADFVLSTHGSPAVKRFEAAIQTNDARVMANYTPQDDEEPEEDVRIDMPPAPIMSTQTLPFTYYYQQNYAARQRATQTQAGRQQGTGVLPPRQFLLAHSFFDGPVPTCPSEHIFTTEEILAVKTKLQALFEQEPMWTRRKMCNILGFARENTTLKYALAHVAFVWRAGPWRDSYCKFGVDPRTDPALRKYQSVYFLHKPKADGPQHEKNETHIFDGVTPHLAARTFALCDISDPVIVQIIQRATVRTECDPKDGWFRHATINAVRHVLKEKAVKLSEGQIPSDAEFRDILIHADDADAIEAVAQLPTEAEAEEEEGSEAEDEAQDAALDARIATQLNQAFESADLGGPDFEVDFGSDDSD